MPQVRVARMSPGKRTAATAQVSRYATTYQAYTQPELDGWLKECGFGRVAFYPSLVGVEDASQRDLFAVVAETCC